MASLPVPLVVQPTFNWGGNDGNWSTFQVNVGTPSQSFHVFPSVIGGDTWVISPDFCTRFAFEGCAESRGVQLVNGSQTAGFQSNASDTWNAVGIYGLTTAQNLFGAVNGSYGLDNVSLGGSTSTTLSGQLIAQVANESFWLGSFPLGAQSSQFDVERSEIPSLLSSLKTVNKTPSLSYGYSAGAYYRSAAGGLVLGGYDAAAFEPNNASFGIETNASRPLTVNLRSMIATRSLVGTQAMPLGEDGLNMSIDSSVSQMWLPTAVCDQVAETFGLTYDAETGLYQVNSTMHSQLINLHPEMTLTLATGSGTNDTVDIVLPYAAFDQLAGPPIYANQTTYFPIGRAADESQYVLGRTFLQEAYLIVDWERQNFTVAQSTHQNGVSMGSIVPIQPPEEQSGSSGLSAGAIAGAVVGVVVGLALVFTAVWLIWWRKRRSQPADSGASVVEHYQPEKVGIAADETSELPSEERKEMAGDDSRTELGGDSSKKDRHELWSPADTPQLMSSPVYELAGDTGRQELEGTVADQDKARLYTHGM